MNFIIKKDTGRKIENKETKEMDAVYDILGELEFFSLPIIGQKFELNKKSYAVQGFILNKDNKNERSIVAIEVDKKYEAPIIDEEVRFDRFKHKIEKTKDGGERTIDDAGKVIREWDKEGKLIKGKPYNQE